MSLYKWLLLLHVLGWSQWVAGQLVLTGLLRRPGVVAAGGEARGWLRGFWIATAAGAAMAIAGAAALLALHPPLLRQGFVHAKFTIALVLLGIWLGPVRNVYAGLESGTTPLDGRWFGLSLALFVTMMALGILRPF